MMSLQTVFESHGETASPSASQSRSWRYSRYFLATLLAGVVGCHSYALDIDGSSANGASTSQKITQSWPHYRGDLEGSGFSRANQITPQNVKSLKQAWSFSTSAIE